MKKQKWFRVCSYNPHLQNIFSHLHKLQVDLKKQKWFRVCSYNPHLQNIFSHLHKLQVDLDSLHGRYDRMLLIRDLNCEIEDDSLAGFCNENNLVAQVKDTSTQNL